jgi:glycerophosphoryl diester phosphodiesterase
MACSTKKDIDVQGHRGCRGLMPENSLPAFKKAIDLGVNTLELDIAITKDKQVVVSHEPFMSRVICLDSTGQEIPESKDKAYNLYNMSHTEIKAFDCGKKFHKGYPEQQKITVYKPLLREVFDLVKANNTKVRFNIEIKSKPEYYGIYTPEPEEYVMLVLNEIEANGMKENSNLQSFDLNILEEIKLQSPDMAVALLVDEDEDIDKKLSQLSFQPELLSPYYKLLSKESVRKYQNKNFLVIPWTVNAKADMKKLLSWGADGIITDYPNILLDILK